MSKVMRAIDAKSFVIGALLAVTVGLVMGAQINYEQKETEDSEALWSVHMWDVKELVFCMPIGVPGFCPGMYAPGMKEMSIRRGAEPFAVVGDKIFFKTKHLDVTESTYKVEDPKKIYYGPKERGFKYESLYNKRPYGPAPR